MSKKKKKQTNSIFKSIIRWSTTKYGLVTIIFVVWLGFLDQRNLVTKYKLKHTIAELEDKIKHNEEELALAKKEKIDIDQNIEKYAREKYFMHAPDEDVLIIDTKSETITQ